jgi:diacylglycerol kinase family enzyme
MAVTPNRISVLINEHSGLTPRADAGEEIQSLFAAAGLPVRIERVRHGGDLAARARQAAGRGDVLVAAGGDGTVGTVAGVAVDANATFGVIPLGTLNHFAKDAGIPLQRAEAVQNIVEGHVRDVDVGDLNGRIFVNNSSVGIYPRMVWERNAEQRNGRSKWVAFVIAMARAWNRYRLLAARLSIDQQHHAVRTPFIFVGNNEYAVEGFQLGARTVLDGGRLSIFIAPEIGRFEILLLPLRGLAKRLTSDPKFECHIAEQATIELSRHRANVALDGEVTVMQLPLQYRVRRRALHLIVPGPSSS